MAMDIYAVWSSTRQDEAGIADRCVRSLHDPRLSLTATPADSLAVAPQDYFACDAAEAVKVPRILYPATSCSFRR